jgi:hypothetical protein
VRRGEASRGESSGREKEREDGRGARTATAAAAAAAAAATATVAGVTERGGRKEGTGGARSLGALGEGEGDRARERVTGGPGCGDPKSRIRHAVVYRS